MDEKSVNKVEEGQAIAEQVICLIESDPKALDQADLLKAFAEKNPYAKGFFERMSDETYLRDGIANYLQDGKEEHAENLTQQIEKKRKNRVWMHLFYATSSVAAVVVAGILLFRSISPVEELPGVAMQEEEIPAMIVASGDTILLLDSQQEIKIGNTVVGHTVVNKIDYSSQAAAVHPGQEYHTLVVPGKSVYIIVLSDGTEVTLNTGSRLTYPVNFDGDLRKVQMEGEICFDVSKRERQPFIVTTGNVSVRVLGTLFNMEAYPGEPVITTLVKGKIEVSNGEKSRVIAPNQQVIISPGQFEVRRVYADEFVGWTKGVFHFTDTPLSIIMSKLARWYDADVVFATSSAKNIRFTLEIKRYDDILNILSKIEKSGCVNFRIEGKKIVVEEVN
jgi:hypothetical protein